MDLAKQVKKLSIEDPSQQLINASSVLIPELSCNDLLLSESLLVQNSLMLLTADQAFNLALLADNLDIWDLFL